MKVITGQVSELRAIKALVERGTGYRLADGRPGPNCRPTHVGANCRSFVPTLTDAELEAYAAANNGVLPPGYTSAAIGPILAEDDGRRAVLALPDAEVERALASKTLSSDEKTILGNAKLARTEIVILDGDTRRPVPDAIGAAVKSK